RPLRCLGGWAPSTHGFRPAWVESDFSRRRTFGDLARLGGPEVLMRRFFSLVALLSSCIAGCHGSLEGAAPAQGSPDQEESPAPRAVGGAGGAPGARGPPPMVQPGRAAETAPSERSKAISSPSAAAAPETEAARGARRPASAAAPIAAMPMPAAPGPVRAGEW